MHTFQTAPLESPIIILQGDGDLIVQQKMAELAKARAAIPVGTQTDKAALIRLRDESIKAGDYTTALKLSERIRAL